MAMGQTDSKHNRRMRMVAKLTKLALVIHQATEEHTPIRGNFAYGTEAEDRAAEEFTADLARRSIWGWCCVVTTAEYAGFNASTSLGCCSHESAEDFIKSDGDTQAFEACAALLDEIEASIERGAHARNVLSAVRSGAARK